MVHDFAAALADALAARDGGADLVEFRIDEVFSGEDSGFEGDSFETKQILALIADSPLPCIVTCRSTTEGGSYDGGEEARVALYERLGTAQGKGEHPPRFLDFELDRYCSSENLRMKIDLAVDASRLREHAPSLILSNHDFAGRPADLTRRLLRMRAQPAAKILKFAFRARSLRDNLELFDMLAERDRPLIALGMGEFGLVSRILAPKFGGFLTFASLRSTSTTAPGQPTVRELLGTYRFRSIGPRTKVYGIVGWPVGHSHSPLVHNAGFEAIGHDGVYVPLPVAAGASDAGGGDAEDSYASFKATVLAIIEHPRLDLCGLSVTIPHKENLVRLAREQGWELDALSALCGAGNTVAIDRGADGAVAKVRVLNTDAPAALECVRELVGDLRGQKIAVLGAGGVARAIVMALAQAGSRVVIFNRSRPRAEKLAESARKATGADVTAGPDPAAATGAYAELEAPKAWINCTPLGMKGGPDPAASALPEAAFGNSPPHAAVLDTVYNPPRTPMLQRATAAGWRTADGIAMFVGQAGAQFLAWTGTKAPSGLFERVVRESLGVSGV